MLIARFVHERFISQRLLNFHVNNSGKYSAARVCKCSVARSSPFGFVNQTFDVSFSTSLRLRNETVCWDIAPIEINALHIGTLCFTEDFQWKFKPQFIQTSASGRYSYLFRSFPTMSPYENFYIFISLFHSSIQRRIEGNILILYDCIIIQFL